MKGLLLMIASAQAFYTFTKGPSFEVVYDEASKKMKLTATVPENMYLGLAYGAGMNKVDMVTFQAKDDGKVTDLWGEGYQVPTTDKQQDYTDTKVTKADGSYNFVTYRALDTGDDQDTVLSCSDSQAFHWVAHSKSADIVKHDYTGQWTLNLGLNADCSQKSGGGDAGGGDAGDKKGGGVVPTDDSKSSSKGTSASSLGANLVSLGVLGYSFS